MSFNYTKRGFIFSIGLGAAALIVNIAFPELRCIVGLKSESCPSQDKSVNVKLIVETEEKKSLEGVEVTFTSISGAPEIKTTNSDGYVQIRIPSTGDIDVKLSKQGFETLTRTINLGIEPDKVKTYRLKTIISTPKPTSPLTNSQSPVNPFPTISTEPLPSVEQSVFTCEKVNGLRKENYSEDISVGRKFQKPESRILLNKDYPYKTNCKITKNTDNLKLIYALPDNSALEKVKINFYLDGNRVKSLDINRGNLERLSFNTKNISSFAIDLIVDNDDGIQDYLYVIPISTN